MLQRQVCRQPRHSLDLRPRVWFRVPRMSVAVVFFALAEVDAPGQFADDVEVDAAADVGFERRDVDEGVRGEVAGAQVAEGVHFFAELEEALLRADGAGAPFLEAQKMYERWVWGGSLGESLTGPPIAPRITASAFLAAVRASSLNGSPVASIEAWEVVSSCSSGLVEMSAYSRRQVNALGNRT